MMMTKVSPPLVSGDGVQLDDPYFQILSEHSDRKLLYGAIFTALLLHAIFLILPLPQRNAAVPHQTRSHSPRITRTKIPPPSIERRTMQTLSLERRRPLPGKAPENLDPVAEPLPMVALPPDVGPVVVPVGPVASPVAPPAVRPLVPDGLRVTMPILIEQTKITPTYPKIARVARREGHVILTAVIEPDGTISDTQVLRVDPANFGFGAAAVEAVRQWQYEPATQDGRPVAVYFTIYVSFNLR